MSVCVCICAGLMYINHSQLLFYIFPDILINWQWNLFFFFLTMTLTKVKNNKKVAVCHIFIFFILFLCGRPWKAWGLKCLNDTRAFKICSSELLLKCFMSAKKITCNALIAHSSSVTKLWITPMQKQWVEKRISSVRTMVISTAGTPSLRVVFWSNLPSDSCKAYCSAPKDQQMETCAHLKPAGLFLNACIRESLHETSHGWPDIHGGCKTDLWVDMICDLQSFDL